MRTDDIAEELGAVFSSHRIASFVLFRELNEREPTMQRDRYIHDIQYTYVYIIQYMLARKRTSKIKRANLEIIRG